MNSQYLRLGFLGMDSQYLRLGFFGMDSLYLRPFRWHFAGSAPVETQIGVFVAAWFPVNKPIFAHVAANFSGRKHPIEY